MRVRTFSLIVKLQNFASKRFPIGWESILLKYLLCFKRPRLGLNCVIESKSPFPHVMGEVSLAHFFFFFLCFLFLLFSSFSFSSFFSFCFVYCYKLQVQPSLLALGNGIEAHAVWLRKLSIFIFTHTHTLSRANHHIYTYR